MNRKNRIRLSAVMLSLFVIVGSLAYFTDKTSGSFDSKAGTLCLAPLTKDTTLDKNIAPGDTRDLDFAFVNRGTLSSDTRITYTLSYKLDDNSLYDGKEMNVMTLTDGKGLEARKDTSLAAESVTVEGDTIKGEIQDIGENALVRNLKVHFNPELGNEFQNAEFEIHVLVEGKQHAPEAKWEEVGTISYTFKGNELKVVDEALCNVTDQQLGTLRVEDTYGVAYYVQLVDEEGEVVISAITNHEEEYVEPIDLSKLNEYTSDENFSLQYKEEKDGELKHIYYIDKDELLEGNVVTLNVILLQ